MIMSLKQRKIKFKPRIKLKHMQHIHVFDNLGSLGKMPQVTSDKLPICCSNYNLFPLLDILVNQRNNFLLV